MGLSNPDGPDTGYRQSVESAIRKLGLSREEAAELQGYIKRLLDEDKAFPKGYPVESLLMHRYQKDWKHLRIWKEEPVISVEPAFARCVEAVRDGLNLSTFISVCLPVNASAATGSYAATGQAGLGYGSESESTSTRKSRGSSTSRDHKFDSVSSRTPTPSCSKEIYHGGFDNQGFRGSPPPGPLYVRRHSRLNLSSPLRTPSFHGSGSDPGPGSRGRKYPPIVERQYSLPLAHPRPRSLSISRATSPILTPHPAFPPSPPLTPNKPNWDFTPNNHDMHDYTVTECTKTSSYRTRTWYPESHPTSRNTPSFVCPSTPYSNGIIPKMDTTTAPTTPSRKPSARISVTDIIPAPLNLPRPRRTSDSTASHSHHVQRKDTHPRLPHPNPAPPAPPTHRSPTPPNLPITKPKQLNSPPHDQTITKTGKPNSSPREDLIDNLCLGKKRDMTPDFEIIPVTRLSPQSQSQSSQTHQQSHRRERAKSRSRGEDRRMDRPPKREEEREGGSWRKLVCGCCGDEH